MRFQGYPNDDPLAGSWDELGVGAPSIVALAMLASQAMARDVEFSSDSGPSAAADFALTAEARAILVASLPRGLMEVKAINSAFETPDRLLAVHTELEPERWRVFRDRADPHYTIRCFEGFRQLCATGLVMHQLYREFSLSHRGFLRAHDLAVDAEMQAVLDRTVELG